MSILIGRYEFDGPFKSIDELKEKPGLYAVLHFERQEYELIHIAQGHNLRGRIELSPMTDTSSFGTVVLAACYTPNFGRRKRMMMVEELHREFDDERHSQSNHPPSNPILLASNESEKSLSAAGRN
jgi:hypothetical protein